jgi:hypothetical protein
MVLGSVLACLGLFAGGRAVGSVEGQLDKPASSGPVVLGEWNTSFSACYAYATANDIPLLVFWSVSGCHYCNNMIAGFNTSEFTTWQANQKIVMCYIHAASGSKDMDAKNFTRNSSGNYPYVRIYWPKGNVDVKFSGRSGVMTVKSGSLAGQFTASVDKALAGYSPVPAYTYAGGMFLVPGTETSRLEAEAGVTTFVNIPLVRTNDTSRAATNVLVIGSWTNTFKWSEQESSKVIRFDLPAGLAAGAVLTNYLYDAGDLTVGAVGGTNTITVVAKGANTTHNPLWLKERTADTLAAGEWTMDYGVATNRTARQAGEAYTAVYFAGLLWCPWCEAFDNTVVETPEFTDWANRHNIALVVLDNPFRSGVGPTILRYETWTKNIYGYGKSGAGYLSRKMVNMADVPAMEALSYDLGYRVLNLPENTRGFVTYPTLVLLRKDGSVAGRWVGQDMGDQHYHFLKDPMLKRLEEMVSLAGDQTEERNRDWALTETGLGVPGSAAGTLQAVDSLDVFKLTVPAQSTRVRVDVKGPAAGSVRLSMFQLTAAGATNTLGAVEGNLSGDGVTVFGRVPVEGACYVAVAATTNDGAFWPQSETSTIRSYTVKTSVAAPLPGSEAKQGEWTSDLDAAKAYAEKYAVPMITVSVNDCDACGLLESTLVQSEFTDWAAARKPLMVLQTGADDAACPYVSVYWPKEDGVTVSTNFTGRAGQMPVKTPVAPEYSASTSVLYMKALAQQLIASIDGVIPDWDPMPAYAGGTFLVPGTETARLEAEVGYTTHVEIPFVRSIAKSLYAATNTLVIGSWTNTFEWAAGETNKCVDFPIPAGVAAGDVLTSFLLDTVYTNTITMVALQPVSSENPLWIGERTADTLQAGEWTMDLDVATNRTARQAGDAYTLVVVGGELWCPDCIGARTNLLGTAEFAEWVASNNVSLVLVDIPNNGNVPSFLTRDVYKNGASGAAYLSRKMIADADAKAIFDRNHGLCFEAWNLPYEGRKRLWLPSFVLLRKDGTYVGKKSDYDRGDYKYPLAPQIQRFYEMITMAADPTEGLNCDPATTALSIGLTDSRTNSLQSVDKIDVWGVPGASAGVRIHAALSGASAAEVKLTLKQIGNGATTTVATATGDLKSGISIDSRLASSGPAYLFVEATDAEVFSKVYSGSTVRGYELATSFILEPQDSEGSYTYRKGGTVPVAVESGLVYRLTGFGDLSSVSGLTVTNAALGLYVATKSGTVELPLGSGSGTVSYRQWNPGTVGFVSAGQRLIESDTTGYVVVSRTGGTSGECTADVTLDVAASATNAARFVWSNQTVTWADGEKGEKTNTFTVVKNSVFEGQQTFVLALNVANTGVALGTLTHAVQIFDTDDPVLGQEAYDITLYAAIGYSRSEPIYNIKENRYVTLSKTSGTLPSGLSVAYDKGSEALVISGTPLRVGDYTAVYVVRERRSSGYATGSGATFRFHVKSIGTLNAGYGKAAVYTGCPVYATAGGESVLVGTVNLTVSSTGRLTARYYSTSRSSTSFSLSKWTGFDEGSGELTAVFPTRLGSTLTLAMAADGTVTGAIRDPANAFAGVTSDLSVQFLKPGDFSTYGGYYTVTLPYKESDMNTPADLVNTNANGQAFAASGTGYLTLKMNTSYAIRLGRVLYAGVLANGTAVSGYAYLLPNGDGTASLSVFKRTTREILGAVMNVKADAASTYATDPQIILTQPGVIPYWQHNETGYSYRVSYDIFGGYYNTRQVLADCCSETYATTEMHFVVGNEIVSSASQAYGEVASVPDTIVAVSDAKLTPASRPNNLSLFFTRSTGIFRGTFKITFAGGRSLTATYKGVLLPGWTDCGCTEESIVERPFGSGSCWFTDRYNGRSVRRGMSVDLAPAK